jgi:hypothetical protein
MPLHPARRGLLLLVVAAVAALGFGCDAIYYRTVSKDLFKEWNDELGKYSDRQFRGESERELRETKRRTDALIASMAKAQARIEPILRPLRDRVLFFKHNLNARALGSLTRELDTVRTGVDELIVDMQRSIADADAFIAAMEKESAGAPQ